MTGTSLLQSERGADGVFGLHEVELDDAVEACGQRDAGDVGVREVLAFAQRVEHEQLFAAEHEVPRDNEVSS